MGKTAYSPSGRIAHHTSGESAFLVDLVRGEFALTRDRVEELLSVGAIYVNLGRVFGDQWVPAESYLRIHLSPKRHRVDHIDWRRQILHESDEFLVVNKPPGVPVHATVDNFLDNVLYELKRVTGLPLLVTQRIDIPTTGLVVFAKTPAFQSRFNKWLADRRVNKRYAALVRTAPPLGTLIHFMEKSPLSPKRVFREPSDPTFIRCELEILSVAPCGEFYELEVNLKTGRTHQIRAQLSEIGCAIVGDTLYGDQEPRPPLLREGQIGLHAQQLEWDRNLVKFFCWPDWREKKGDGQGVGAPCPSLLEHLQV